MKILISGDFCPVGRVEKLVDNGNVRDLFGSLTSHILSSDLAITNLEAPITKAKIAIKKTGPSLHASERTIEFLKTAGFSLLTLANNHIMDYGSEGLKVTMELASRHGLSVVGAGLSLDAAKEPYIFEKEGIKLAILNFAENEWSTTHGSAAGANPIDPVGNYYQIRDARGEVDKVIVIVHGGHEMHNLPSPRIKKLFRYYIDCGADVVVGHHPHCISGFENYGNGYIFYSIGNFVFDQDPKFDSQWNTGMVLLLDLDDKGIHYDIVPFKQCEKEIGIRSLIGTEEQNFYDYLKELNKIIQSDVDLENNFEKFSRSKRRLYQSYIEPYSNRYLLALRNRGWFPSLWSRRKRMYLLNLVKCESHRDILEKTLTRW